MNATVPASPWRQDGREKALSFSFRLTANDHIAVRYSRRELVGRAPYIVFAALIGLFVGLLFSFDLLSGDGEKELLGAAILVGSVAAGALTGWLTHRPVREFINGFWNGYLTQREMIDVPVELDLRSWGLLHRVRGQENRTPWSGVLSLQDDGERFLFWIARHHAFVLPKRAIEPPLNDDDVATLIEEWSGRSFSAHHGPPSSAT
ncbi:YcxB family protein [Notoacmeibacter ruber]|uniref:YcxB family protein n=1 Tax=Notoacmeibacter ruber TaxID=2670375 RepID=A0A3L7J923_9HYPH|nr:YcxB family protein [Notoacmeibacter ruber]RLQ86989.1 YcxB family protein [Notoacmeibacter ruber]